MTEEEWLKSNDPAPMLDFLRSDVRSRKLRLFAVACCRRITHLLIDERSRKAVDVAERLAAGSATNSERRDAALAASADDIQGGRASGAASCALLVSPLFAAQRAADNASFAVSHTLESYIVAGMDRSRDVVQQTERTAQTQLLRDIFGNPFRPVTLDPRWLSASVLDLAQSIYDERAFDRMPILADALMDAGCNNDDFLNHCRGDGPHVRGCWIVDLILSKDR